MKLSLATVSIPGQTLASLTRLMIVAFVSILLWGCAQPANPTGETRNLAFRDLLKSDIDQVSDIHRHTVHTLLKQLMMKLYKRNPGQWREHGKPSAKFMLERLFRPRRAPEFTELHGARGVAAIRLAFQPDYGGDRVLAFSSGLTAMLQKAYLNKREFYLTDTLDAQKIYNSARNIEIAAWLLRTSRDPKGKLYLLSYSATDGDVNLSFERLFGKLIATQDNLAAIIAGRYNRTIKTVLQNMLGAVFLPI